MRRPFVNYQTVTRSSSDADYASGDALGGKLTIPIAQAAGEVRSLTIVDLDKVNTALKVLIFDENPSATTVTDNSALDVADADMKYIAGVVSIAASDYVSLSDNSIAVRDDLHIPIRTALSSAYVVLQTAGTATYSTDASNILFKVYIDTD